MEAEWEKTASEGKREQTRFMKSQQALKEKFESKQEGGGGGDDAEGIDLFLLHMLYTTTKVCTEKPSSFLS